MQTTTETTGRQTLVEDADSTVISRAGAPKFQPLRRMASLAALTAVAVVASVVGLGAGPAEAWSSRSSGSIASVTIAPSTARAGAQFRMPGPTIYRNGAVAYGSAQPITVTYSLEYWNNVAWVEVARMSSLPTIPQFSNEVIAPTITLAPAVARAGYYRVGYAVQWGSSWNPIPPYGADRITGAVVIYPSLASEIACGVTSCWAYAGFVLLK